MRSISSYNNSFEYLADDINKYKRTGYRVVLVCNSRTRAARIVADLEELGTQSYFSEDYDKEIMPGTVMVTYGNIHRGFEYPLIGFVIITENDIFTSRTRKKRRRNTRAGQLPDLTNLMSVIMLSMKCTDLVYTRELKRLLLRALKKIISR